LADGAAEDAALPRRGFAEVLIMVIFLPPLPEDVQNNKEARRKRLNIRQLDSTPRF